MSGEKSKVVAGVIIGMALGIALAGIVAWFVVNKNPAEFTGKEKDKTKPAPPVVLLAPSAPVAAPPQSSTEPGQQFEFYKVLPDKSDGSRKSTTRPRETVNAKPVQVAPAVTKELYFVQVGSFQNESDAEKLKAKLAFSGFEATIQTASIPDKGVWHRVRLGPFDNTEAGKTITALRQNGLVATQVRAQ